jgi:hypothetical protein
VATLLICSCVPISRQLVQKIPGLRYAFGNSSDKSSKPHFHAGGANNPGLPLSDYKKSNQTKNQSSFSHHSHAYTSGQIGITTEVIVERADSDSTEEIFPNRDSKRDRAMGRDLSGSIEDESPMSTSWRMDSVENTVRVEAKEHGAL